MILDYRLCQSRKKHSDFLAAISFVMAATTMAQKLALLRAFSGSLLVREFQNTTPEWRIFNFRKPPPFPKKIHATMHCLKPSAFFFSGARHWFASLCLDVSISLLIHEDLQAKRFVLETSSAATQRSLVQCIHPVLTQP